MLSRLFSHVRHGVNSAAHRAYSSTVERMLSGMDPVQHQSMGEGIILIDENDRVLGPVSKVTSHLLLNSGKCLRHRAFTVLLFNSQGDILLQQRSPTKITFPNHYSNTCCSHPLYNQHEMDEKDAIGVKRAAVRRLGIELGISPNDIKPEDFIYTTRMHYYTNEKDKNVFGEHEITYFLIIQKDVKLNPNPDEVKEVQYIPRDKMGTFLNELNSNKVPLTPWFNRTLTSDLCYKWWDNLHQLDLVKDLDTIYGGPEGYKI